MGSCPAGTLQAPSTPLASASGYASHDPLNAETIWRAYEHRWPVEPGIHFRKETFGWTLPLFHFKEAGDRWTELTALTCWIVFLARPLVQEHPWPWQKPQSSMTPQRVQQSLLPIFDQIGTPVHSPKIAWLEKRQAKNTQTPSSCGEETTCCYKIGLKLDF